MTLLNKWLYLSAFCGAVTGIIVLLGNPLLPIYSLAQHGWAWHHIPEVLSFLFFGMGLGAVKGAILKEINWKETIYLIILTTISLALLVVYALNIVIPIVTIPSFMGYLTERWLTLRK